MTATDQSASTPHSTAIFHALAAVEYTIHYTDDPAVIDLTPVQSLVTALQSLKLQLPLPLQHKIQWLVYYRTLEELQCVDDVEDDPIIDSDAENDAIGNKLPATPSAELLCGLLALTYSLVPPTDSALRNRFTDELRMLANNSDVAKAQYGITKQLQRLLLDYRQTHWLGQRTDIEQRLQENADLIQLIIDVNAQQNDTISTDAAKQAAIMSQQLDQYISNLKAATSANSPIISSDFMQTLFADTDEFIAVRNGSHPVVQQWQAARKERLHMRELTCSSPL